MRLCQDRELHKSYLLYKIWLSKSWFVVKAMERARTSSSMRQRRGEQGVFVWLDIGCFRTTEYNGKLLIRHAEVVHDAILMMAHRMPVLILEYSREHV